MIIAPAITIVPLSDDCTKVIGEPVQAWAGTGERCSEGPHIFKKDGWYYAVVAEGGTGYGHGINVGRSRNLYGPYESSPYNPVLRQTDPDAPIQRSGHGCLVETQNGDWWCMYLCGRANNGHYTTLGRETALDPVHWTEDGWFIINDTKPSTEQIMPLPPHKFNENKRYDFDEDALSLDFEWVRNPNINNYSLTERKGWLRLYTGNSPLYEVSSQNTLVRREQELKYSADTRLCFKPENNGEQAGLVCYYATNTYIRFGIVYSDGICLQLAVNRNKGFEEVVKTVPIDCTDVKLRADVDGQDREFYYNIDGEWKFFDRVENCVFLCDEGVPGDKKRHTGTMVGMYANNGGSGARLAAEFDYFNYID
jgi:xylan 1,4-beta-xylosidase